ncbi:hypothetical protein N7447_008107 [Penicillium robsamsonii]|uniref:uncharacterized protein n=1 Tax=Penicillium robsamsonii TaxID=1792511 RepID=UPI002548BC58|nr:uncharacterized protein N7447_008107 [Penicillium robsamsonii]KAJ5815874.1 hypothetical protein N7447_008107 [Penicillium robsamsonii]
MKSSWLYPLSTMAYCAIVAANPLPADELSNSVTEIVSREPELHMLNKRSPVILGLGVYAFIEAAGAAGGLSLGTLANILTNVFKPKEAPWENSDAYCTIYIRTQGGGNCHMEVEPGFAGQGQTKQEHDDWDCAWTDLNGVPPIASFNDPGIGNFRVQFAATDKATYDGSPKCVSEGLCSPRLEFQRNGFYMRIDSWESQGDTTEGEYSGDYGGVCYTYVEDQFTSGGHKLATKCAVPCENQNVIPDSSPP